MDAPRQLSPENHPRSAGPLSGAALLLLALGFLFATVRFVPSGYQRLVTLVCCVAIAWGLAQIRPGNAALKRAAGWALVLAVASAVALLTGPWANRWIRAGSVGIATVLRTLIVWDLCRGLATWYSERGIEAMVRRCTVARWLFACGYTAGILGPMSAIALLRSRESDWLLPMGAFQNVAVGVALVALFSLLWMATPDDHPPAVPAEGSPSDSA